MYFKICIWNNVDYRTFIFHRTVQSECSHFIDASVGRKYDKHGNLHDWWTNSSVTAFDKRTQCLVEEYSAFKVQSENVRF